LSNPLIINGFLDLLHSFFSITCFMQTILSVHDRPAQNPLCSSSSLFCSSMRSLSI